MCILASFVPEEGNCHPQIVLKLERLQRLPVRGRRCKDGFVWYDMPIDDPFVNHAQSGIGRHL